MTRVSNFLAWVSNVYQQNCYFASEQNCVGGDMRNETYLASYTESERWCQVKTVSIIFCHILIGAEVALAENGHSVPRRMIWSTTVHLACQDYLYLQCVIGGHHYAIQFDKNSLGENMYASIDYWTKFCQLFLKHLEFRKANAYVMMQRHVEMKSSF